jgi:hypothetical protein
MARQPKVTIDYFPHHIGNGKKMHTINNKYGNDGYATWFKLLEILGETDNHYLDLSIQSELMYVASKCNISEELLIQIIDDLCKLDEIDPELWVIRVVWNQRFIDSVQNAYNKRSNPCMTKGGVIKIFEQNGRLKTEKKPKSKDKPEKVKSKRFDFKGALIEAGATPETVHAWMAVRTKKRAVNTEIAFNGFMREVKKSGLTIEQSVLTCVEKSWSGFDASWIASDSKGNNKQTHSNSGDNTDWDQAIKETHGKSE